MAVFLLRSSLVNNQIDNILKPLRKEKKTTMRDFRDVEFTREAFFLGEECKSGKRENILDLWTYC